MHAWVALLAAACAVGCAGHAASEFRPSAKSRKMYLAVEGNTTAVRVGDDVRQTDKADAVGLFLCDRKAAAKMIESIDSLRSGRSLIYATPLIVPLLMMQKRIETARAKAIDAVNMRNDAPACLEPPPWAPTPIWINGSREGQ